MHRVSDFMLSLYVYSHRGVLGRSFTDRIRKKENHEFLGPEPLCRLNATEPPWELSAMRSCVLASLWLSRSIPGHYLSPTPQAMTDNDFYNHCLA